MQNPRLHINYRQWKWPILALGRKILQRLYTMPSSDTNSYYISIIFSNVEVRQFFLSVNGSACICNEKYGSIHEGATCDSLTARVNVQHKSRPRPRVHAAPCHLQCAKRSFCTVASTYLAASPHSRSSSSPTTTATDRRPRIVFFLYLHCRQCFRSFNAILKCTKTYTLLMRFTTEFCNRRTSFILHYIGFCY